MGKKILPTHIKPGSQEMAPGIRVVECVTQVVAEHHNVAKATLDCPDDRGEQKLNVSSKSW